MKKLILFLTLLLYPVLVLAQPSSTFILAVTDDTSAVYTTEIGFSGATVSEYEGKAIVTVTGGGGSGDVTSVGDCASGACFDGTSDGGTYLDFYDAQGRTRLIGGNTAAEATLTLPNTTGTLIHTEVDPTVDTSAEIQGILGDIYLFNNGDTATGSYDFGGASVEVPNSATLPVTCVVGQIYMDTDATSGQRIYACQATDTWVLQGDGGGGGAGDITSVGDCADGACFDGTQGTTLTFNNAGGDATIVYDGSTFTFNKFITSSLTGAVTGIASGNALPALSNLASVAINTSLISDLAATDDLGTEAIYWRKLYLGSDISFEGATDDAYQTTLTAVDTTLSDKSINIPNASGTMAVSVTAPVTLSVLGDVGVTVAKDIVAGVGLSGGENDVLPGADADTTLTFDATELEGLTWGAGAAASIVHTYNVSGTDTTMTMGSALTTFSGGLTTTLDLIVSGGDITLGTTSIFSGGDTASLNNIDAIDATTETTLEGALDIAGEVTSTGMGTTVVADSLTVASWTLTTPIFSGAVTLSENASLAIDPAIGTDHQWCGITETGTGGATIAIGDLVSLHTDGEWYLVDANTAAASSGDARRKLGMAVTTSTDGNAITVLLWGKIRHDAFADTLVIGDAVYCSETAGAVEVTQPTTTDVVIRVIGFGNTADELYFCPENSYMTHT